MGERKKKNRLHFENFILSPWGQDKLSNRLKTGSEGGERKLITGYDFWRANIFKFDNFMLTLVLTTSH